jgi:outer membrane protein TolC
VELARKNLDVAGEALEMTRARMEAGVINTVEVVQAQETEANARLDLVNAIFAHNLAKLNLARALGHAGDHLRSMLRAEQSEGPAVTGSARP